MCRFVFFLHFFVLVFSFQPSLFAAPETNSIQIKGSDTMVNLGQAWAEAFMEQHPEALIAVTGGGSGTGISALMSGSCDIAQSSRDMSPKEFEQAKSKGLDVQDILVGIDAVVMVVHPDNPVEELTIDQLSDIFTEKITNWKEVGGKDESILVLSRERNSGTHVYVLEDVVRKGKKDGSEEFAPSVLMLSSSQAIEQEVSSSLAALGYFGLGYLNPNVKALRIFNSKTNTYVAPSMETALDKTYPLSRPLHFYLPRPPEGIVKEFSDFVLSDEGQKIVQETHFVPIEKQQVPAQPQS